MTTYNWPSTLTPQSFSLVPLPREASFQSLLAGTQQTVHLGGDTLRMSMGFSALRDADRRLLLGFMGRLRGKAHRFSLHDLAHPGNSLLTAYSSNTITANGATDAGARKIADTTGWPTSTEVLRRGDQLSIGDFLYLVTSDSITTNASGQSGEIEVFPSVPATGISDGDGVTLEDPVGTWIVTDFDLTDAQGVSRARLIALQDVAV